MDLITSYSRIYNKNITSRDDYIYKNSIVLNREWEPAIINSINRYLVEGTDFIDIGAHIGLITLSVSNFKKAAKIHSFECDPVNFTCLRRNTRGINNINLYNFGLSDSNKICTINENTYNSGCNHINSTINSNGSNKYDYSWLQEVKDNYLHNINSFYSLVPLDSLKYLFHNGISVIKIDVEGYEYFVLEGAKEIILLHKPVIIIEIGEDNLDKVNKQLNQLGYYVAELLPSENFVYLKN
jgi:FkbM family methyltransferase